MQEKGPSIFDCINAVNEKIPTYKYNKKLAPAYMLLLWLSISETCMPCVDRINERLFEMPNELVFAALYKGIPKGKRFVKWPKKGTKNRGLSKKEEDIIKELMEEHGFSEFEAKTLFKRYIDV